MRRTMIVALMLTLAASCALAQEQREVQMDTKAIPAMYVAFDARTNTMEEMGRQIPGAFARLGLACADNGYHPLGYGIIVVTMFDAPVAGQEVDWEIWLPIVDLPTEDDLAEDAVVRVKQVPSTHVAFTYHVGDFPGIQDAYMRLVTWAVDEGMGITGESRTIMYTEGDGDGQVIAECQMQIAKPQE